jgi:hypothetical protein
MKTKNIKNDMTYIRQMLRLAETAMREGNKADAVEAFQEASCAAIACMEELTQGEQS